MVGNGIHECLQGQGNYERLARTKEEEMTAFKEQEDTGVVLTSLWWTPSPHTAWFSLKI